MHLPFTLLSFVLCTTGIDAVAPPCVSCIDPLNVPDLYRTRHYNDYSVKLLNPHRGFVNQVETHSGNHSALLKTELDDMRNKVGLSMIRRMYVLDTFVTDSISSDYIDKIRADMTVLESAGFTVVLRFCYITETRTSHPYGDANKNTVMHHINQLKPIFHEYEKIITSIEAGFIGASGEWNTTDHFGSPEWNTPGHDPVTGLMPQAFIDRKDVFLAVLHAAPKSIQVQLPNPAQKIHMMGSSYATFFGVQSKDDDARTGHHNDCFLASDTDMGTYHDKAVEYPYLEHDTRYTIMGGETCGLTDNSRHECPTALREMAMFHWTFLNQGVKPDVYDVWRQQGCYDDVFNKLGYRIGIKKAILPKFLRPNDDFCFHFEFDNLGFAAPVKNFKFNLILRNVHGSYRNHTDFAATIRDVDLRDWQPGYTHTVASTVHAKVPEGKYQVMISLSDLLMGEHADFNVLLASFGVDLDTPGLNYLGHLLTVNGTAGSHSSHNASSLCPSMARWTPPDYSWNSRVFRGSLFPPTTTAATTTES